MKAKPTPCFSSRTSSSVIIACMLHTYIQLNLYTVRDVNMATDKRSFSVRYSRDTDSETSTNNGYIRTTVTPMEHKPYNPFWAWTGLNKWKMTNSQLRVTLSLAVLVISSVVYFFQQNLINFMHTVCGLFSPMFSVICSFYWLALYLRKSWTGSNVYVFFVACFLGEIFGQVFMGAGDIFNTWLVASVLLSASLISLTSPLSTSESALVITFLSLMRFMTGSTLAGISLWLRPFFAYFCGVWGCFLAKYSERHLFKHSPLSLANHFSTDGKIPVIRRRRTSSQSSTTSLGHKTRRTSLPALIQKNACSSAVDLTVMQEAHGLIMDMLADSSLPPNVVSGLKAVSSLLSPPSSFNTLQRPKISPLVALNESSYTSDIDDSPYVGDRQLSLPRRLRRSLPPNLIRRMSSTWTTTTSATGMPTLEPQPLRTRSSSFRHSRDSTSSLAGDSRSSSPSTVLSARPDSNAKYRSLSVGTGGNSPRSLSPVQLGSGGRSGRSSFSSGSTSDDAMEGLSPRLEIPSYDDRRGSGEGRMLDPRKSITLTITNNSTPVDGEEQQATKDGSEVETVVTETPPSHPPVKKRNSVTINETVTIIEDGGGRLNAASDVEVSDEPDGSDLEEIPEDWDPTPPECQDLLSGLDEWDFPIFDLALASGDSILSNVAYRLFVDAGIFETFRLPVKEFMNYFRALENGYRDKPYHNRIHAADVLHGVYFMCTQQIPGFTQVNPEDLDPICSRTDKSGEEGDSAFHTPAVTPRASLSSDSSYGILAGNLPALELMALFTAAAMHDYDHPGRTNAFLVATKAPQAILYNDRSVLENHHAASSWSLFLSKPEYNFLSSLDEAEFRRFRYLVVELILATDLKRHFDFLVEFNAKVNDVDAPGINWASESDRLLVAEMCIKLADISGPTKQKDLHMNWTNRISEEFYDQGDAEAKLGLPISPYMDRNNSQLAKLQEGFINHLVAPLCNAYGSAGLLPGLWLDEEDHESTEKSDKDDSETSSISPRRDKEDGEKEEEDDEDDDDDSSSDGTGEDSKLIPKSTAPQKTRKMVSILTKHLKENHEMWLNILKEEEKAKVNENDSPSEETVVSAKPMAPIREDSEERTSDTHSAEEERSTDGQSDPVSKTSVMRSPSKEVKSDIEGSKQSPSKVTSSDEGGQSSEHKTPVQKVPSVVVEGETIVGEHDTRSSKPSSNISGAVR